MNMETTRNDKATRNIETYKIHYGVCDVCGKRKPESEFHKSHTIEAGIQNYCKECKAEWAKNYYLQQKGMENKNIDFPIFFEHHFFRTVALAGHFYGFNENEMLELLEDAEYEVLPINEVFPWEN